MTLRKILTLQAPTKRVRSSSPFLPSPQRPPSMLSLPALLARSLRLPTTPTLPSFPSAFGISTRRELSSLETGRASTSTTFRRKEKEEEHSTSTSTATPRSMASPSDVDLSEMDSDGYKVSLVTLERRWVDRRDRNEGKEGREEAELDSLSLAFLSSPSLLPFPSPNLVVILN